MPEATDLQEAVNAYRIGRISLDQFEDWFRGPSRAMFGQPPHVLEAYLAIDAAFSEVRDGGMPEHDFGLELAAAIRPFEQSARQLNLQYLIPRPSVDTDPESASSVGFRVRLKRELVPSPGSPDEVTLGQDLDRLFRKLAPAV